MDRVNTQFPTKNNVAIDPQTPLPIETAYFLEDGEQDPSTPNRYYFKFPEEWCTSNRGESIVGVRNIFMNPRRRKLEYTVGVRKYHRKDYDRLEREYPGNTELIYANIDPRRKSQTSFRVVSWLPSDKDLREIFIDLNDAAAAHFEVVNEEIKLENAEYMADDIKVLDVKIEEVNKVKNQLANENTAMLEEIAKLELERDAATTEAEKQKIKDAIGVKETERTKKTKELNEKITQLKELERQKIEKENDFRPYFQQEIEKLRRRDIQMDGYYSYERNCFVEVIESPKNAEPQSVLDELDTENYKYYVDIRITFTPRPDSKESQEGIYDFADVMNVGYKPFQNDPNKYLFINSEGFIGKWCRRLEFENVWDRHSLKVYSSLAMESARGYLGDSQIFFEPIKYFKLNSTDQRFWIEFYSGRFHKIPIKIPLNESFVIEMQLLPFDKLLYV